MSDKKDLNQEDLKRLRDAALAGDVSAIDFIGMRKLALEGNPDKQLEYALALSRGHYRDTSFDADILSAEYWLSKAAEHGNLEARRILDSLPPRPNFSQSDYGEMFRQSKTWFEALTFSLNAEYVIDQIPLQRRDDLPQDRSAQRNSPSIAPPPKLTVDSISLELTERFSDFDELRSVLSAQWGLNAFFETSQWAFLCFPDVLPIYRTLIGDWSSTESSSSSGHLKQTTTGVEKYAFRDDFTYRHQVRSTSFSASLSAYGAAVDSFSSDDTGYYLVSCPTKAWALLVLISAKRDKGSALFVSDIREKKSIVQRIDIEPEKDTDLRRMSADPGQHFGNFLSLFERAKKTQFHKLGRGTPLAGVPPTRG